MNLNLKAKILILVAAFLLFGHVGISQASATKDSFVVHAYYSNNEFVWQDDGSYIEASTQSFAAPKSTDYFAELYNAQGGQLLRSAVDPLSNNTSGKEGEIAFSIPFDKTTAKVRILDKSGVNVFGRDILIETANYCNRNNVCESDLNESNLTCAIDCSSAAASGTTTVPTAAQNGGVSGWLWVLLSVIIIGATGFTVWYFRNRKTNDAEESLPWLSGRILIALFVAGALLLSFLLYEFFKKPVEVSTAVPNAPSSTVSTSTSTDQGPARHSASEISGCAFSDSTSKEVGLMTEPLFQNIKTICEEVSSKGLNLTISHIVTGNYGANSFHYKGCATDFAGADAQYTLHATGMAVIAAAKSLGMRINPGSDANQTFHVHVDIGSACTAPVIPAEQRGS